MSERSSVVPPPPDWRRSEAPTAPVGTTLPSSTTTDGAAEGPARHPSFHPGARITEKYVVEYLIGQGEVGVVVAAKHVHLDQQVAIKCMRPTPPGTKDPAQHFLREARLVAQIRSEHLVHVHEVGTLPEGEPYIVMDCLSGTDLRSLISTSGGLPVELALDYVLQACEGLAEAHVSGIVHRGIKPSNLFLATSFVGRAVLKVLDFGNSMMLGKTTSGGGGEPTLVLTGPSVYMSPEQLVAGNLDVRTDIWALGVVLYELLAGTLPFEGDSPSVLRDAILHEPPMPLLHVRPDLPIQLPVVIGRCLAKDAGKRFQNVAELAQELRPFVGPAGRERIEHVVRVIHGAPHTVRPSMPPPSKSRVEPRGHVSTLAEPTETSVATTEIDVEWDPAPALHKGAGRRRRRLVAALGASVVMAALTKVVLNGAPSSPAPRTDHAVLPAPTTEPSLQPIVAAPASTPSAGPQPSPTVDVVAPPSLPLVAPLPRPPLVAAPPQRSHGRPRTIAKPAATSSLKDVEQPSHADPNAVLNPFD